MIASKAHLLLEGLELRYRFILCRELTQRQTMLKRYLNSFIIGRNHLAFEHGRNVCLPLQTNHHRCLQPFIGFNAFGSSPIILFLMEILPPPENSQRNILNTIEPNNYHHQPHHTTIITAR